jgi:hypothetical protein
MQSTRRSQASIRHHRTAYLDSTTNKLFLPFALPLALSLPLVSLFARSLLAARFHLASSLSSRSAPRFPLVSSLSSRSAPRFPLVPLLAFILHRSYLALTSLLPRSSTSSCLALRFLLASLFTFVFVSVTCSFLRLILFLQHGVRYRSHF